MNSISDVFKKDEGIFIPFITAGDPNFDKSLVIAHKLFDCGADILELGIPFSDPISDGPTIQASSERALNCGMNTKKAMKMASNLKERGPLVFMTYYNLVLQYGLERFVLDSKYNGVQGLIVPDLPIDEADQLYNITKMHDFSLIFLIAPTTPDKRIEKIVEKSDGYLYLVSTLGVTGARDEISKDIKNLISKVKKIAKGRIPIALGFGISTPKHVKEVLSYGADGVIVGSAIVKLIKDGDLSKLEKFVLSLKQSSKKTLK